MSIKKVWVEEGCTASGICSDICPEVFVLKDVSTVVEGVKFTDYEDLIKEAAANCPAEVIKYSE